MNPLTLVKRIQNINSREATLGISEEASWHSAYKDSAYVYVGGIPFDLTEGDLLAVFAQYGEIVDVNLVRDKATGKSKGFAFVAYEDQRSTNLAVDNLNGAEVSGRIMRVDHVSKYKKKEEEDEETVRQKREARGVCRAFQRGECSRGDGCKFSHDEQRASNTGWGPQDHKNARWGHENFEGSRDDRKIGLGEKVEHSGFNGHDRVMETRPRRSDGKEEKVPGRRYDDRIAERNEKSEDCDRREEIRLSRRNDRESEAKHREDRHGMEEKRRRDGSALEARQREVDERRESDRFKRHESESRLGEDRDRRGSRGSTHHRDSSSHHHREKKSDHH